MRELDLPSLCGWLQISCIITVIVSVIFACVSSPIGKRIVVNVWPLLKKPHLSVFFKISLYARVVAILQSQVDLRPWAG
jgi:hypothetical protein